MKTYELVVPCHFGLEAVLKREIYDLGYEISRVEDGRVSFQGDAEAVCRANIFLRTAERVLIEVGRFRATTFEELFQGIKALPWEDYIPVNGKFWVKKASSIKSKLFSPSDIQSIAKKAMVERMKQYYDVEWFAEDGAPYPVRIFLLKDEVMVTLDTSGDSLHKRGYRTLTSKAPLTETLAASLLLLTPWRPDRILVDPFCGSGTIAIEAALIAKNRAPGLDRSFDAQRWAFLPAKVWMDAADEAMDKEFHGKYEIWGGDIDPDAVELSRHNAELAEVDDIVKFEVDDATRFHWGGLYGRIVTNPPYGERLLEREEAGELYKAFGKAMDKLPDTWRVYVLSSHPDFERCYGRFADKKRKLYNGMLKCDLFMYGKRL